MQWSVKVTVDFASDLEQLPNVDGADGERARHHHTGLVA
jgi:hypothetical protein